MSYYTEKRYFESRIREILRAAMRDAACTPVYNDNFQTIVEEYAKSRFGEDPDFSDDQIQEVIKFTINMCRLAMPPQGDA